MSFTQAFIKDSLKAILAEQKAGKEELQKLKAEIKKQNSILESLSKELGIKKEPEIKVKKENK